MRERAPRGNKTQEAAKAPGTGEPAATAPAPRHRSDLIDSVVNLTAYRDRDQIDATIVSILAQWLQPREVAMYALIGERDDTHLLLRARLRARELIATSEPVWTPLDQLPRLDERDACQRAVAGARIVTVAAAANEHVSVFPVMTERETVGVLEVTTEEPMSVRDHHLVTGMLRIYRNYLSLLDDSERDTLTGLLNRKTFEQTFGKLLSSAADPSAPVHPEDRRHCEQPPRPWLGVVDIDHFKVVNDRHGHLIGDEVLLLVTRILHSTFRVQDRLYRFGGEEFVALVHCDSPDHAHAAFERLRANVEAYEFPQVGRLTVSVGHAQLRTLDTPSSAFNRADQAVYYAKQHGRNQVCSFDDLLARGEVSDQVQDGNVELF